MIRLITTVTLLLSLTGCFAGSNTDQAQGAGWGNMLYSSHVAHSTTLMALEKPGIY